MKLPKLEIKKKGTIKDINNIKKRFEIGNYVLQPQGDNPKKVFILEEIFFEDGKKEIRVGYYIIGAKGRMEGKWLWGEFCPIFPKADLEKLIEKAKERGIL